MPCTSPSGNGSTRAQNARELVGRDGRGERETLTVPDSQGGQFGSLGLALHSLRDHHQAQCSALGDDGPDDAGVEVGILVG